MAPVQRGILIGQKDAGVFTRKEAAARLRALGQDPASARTDVELISLVYSTVDERGAPTMASGLVALPRARSGPLRVVSYQHGTVPLRMRVPSNIAALDDPEAIADTRATLALFAAAGYAVVAADYIGLGQSPLQRHRYMHAATEASACLDLLRAARAFSAKIGVEFEPGVFLVGFSQGGHATLALQRAIEAAHREELFVVAAAPAAGTYDMTRTFLQLLDRHDPGIAFHLAYVLTAYNAIYDVYGSPSEAFTAPYDAQIEGLYEGRHDPTEIGAVLPAKCRDLLRPAFIAETADPWHPLRRALCDNDVYAFSPRAPVRLYASRADLDVPYENMVTAHRELKARGATVDLVDLGPEDHAGTLMRALPLAKAWFDTLPACAPH
ncbi:alpha/beta fold hydrolase [Polyangium aurulentum]|uniref:alpha/beta fold hydrolase n=1 Tax=Polyangium aurulentum TaxID=2567896 RepID=UPI0010AEE8C2|nr:alpha/beta fold hydrolase [Polyangium aurulentum]UQA57200.1 hypothetical protein E8A73_038820 [Polyangium aurulentum]